MKGKTMPKQTKTITLDEVHDTIAKFIMAVRKLNSRSGVIAYLLEKEVKNSPKDYPSGLLPKQ
jgi:hypothetical protein